MNPTLAENVHTLAGIISLLWGNSSLDLTDSDIAAINLTKSAFIKANKLTEEDLEAAEDIVINKQWGALTRSLGENF